MGASRPTAARKAAAVPVWPQTQNLFVGAGFIPPAGVCAAVGPPGRCEHRPLQGFVVMRGRSFPVGRGIFPGSAGRAFTPAAHWRFKIETFAPPRGAAGWGHPALRTPGGLRLSGFAGHVRKVCRGGACPSRGALPYREHPRDDASIVPYRGLCNAGPQLPGWPPHRRRPQGPAPQKQNTTSVPPCRISIAAARPRTASKL